MGQTRMLRRVLRGLLRAPAFTLPTVVTVAVATGAAVAVFSLVYAVLLRPLPYADPTRIATIAHSAAGLGIESTGLSAGLYVHYRERSRQFAEIGAYMERDLSVTDGDPERVRATLATPSVFEVLGVNALHGRLFTESDGAPGAPGVALLSHSFWVRRYGADPRVIGRTIELNRVAREIVGIMPPGFDFPRPGTALWFAMPLSGRRAGVDVHSMYLSAIGRLKSGVTADDAARDLQRLIGSLPDVYADLSPDTLRAAQLRALVTPLKEALIDDVRPALALLALAAAFLVLIAWTNVVNLFLVRAERLRKDVAVERALGAGGAAVLARFLAEGALVSAAGGALGAFFAYAAVKARFGFAEGDLPRLHEVELGGAAVAVAVALTLAGAALFGLVSFARAAYRPDAGSMLKGVSARVAGSRRQRRSLRLVVSLQIALALALLIGSALMAQSFWRLKQVRLGFDPADVLTLEVPLPSLAYSEYWSAADFFVRLTDRIRSVPGVRAVGAVQAARPLASVPPFLMEPLAADPAAGGSGVVEPSIIAVASPGYFDAMRIPLIRGRPFQTGDVASDAHPVIVSAVIARRLFGDEDPIGKRLRFADQPEFPGVTIVGVAADVPGETIAGGASSIVYVPLVEDYAAAGPYTPEIPYYFPNEMTVVVRTDLPPTSLVPAIRRIMAELDPQIPIANVMPMMQIVAGATARTRLTMLLLTLAAVASLLLGTIGVYGTISYAVAQRTSEFGVRLALGASPADLTRMVLRNGAIVGAVGTALGILAALALTRFLRGLLFQVRPADPITYVGAAALVFGIAALASVLPARRAGRTPPVAALREE